MTDDIIAVGDVHEGINFGFGLDPITGVTARAMDIHENFARSAQYAIKRGSKLLVVLGDLFERAHVSPVFREMVRRDVIEPLGKEGIEVWILAGNHDQPRSMARGTSLDDFRGYSHVKVFRTPAVEKKEIGGRQVGFIIAPYLHPEQIAQRVREELGKEIARDDMFHAARKVWKEWIGKSAEELGTEVKVMFGHYHIEGSQLSAFNRTQYLPSEFSFTRDMIPEDIDLAIFGHIHLHQALSDKMVYAGSIERIDWGESEEDKGFLSIDLESKKWNFVKLKVRDMVKLDVDLSGSESPTEDIASQIPADLGGKMVRLNLKGKEGFRARIDEAELEDSLRKAFHYEVKWEELRAEKGGFVEFTIDPLQLFTSFVKLNYGKHPSSKNIQECGREILNEVLE
jgi:exonuclease SbcD